MAVVAPASKFFGRGKWGKRKLKGGKKMKKNVHEAHKNLLFCHLYTEMVKFGLILTHLYFFFFVGEGTGQKDIWEQMPPVVPPLRNG